MDLVDRRIRSMPTSRSFFLLRLRLRHHGDAVTCHDAGLRMVFSGTCMGLISMVLCIIIHKGMGWLLQD